ncbi:unnamed protein product, partial [Ascophyllum nodosum]
GGARGVARGFLLPPPGNYLSRHAATVNGAVAAVAAESHAVGCRRTGLRGLSGERHTFALSYETGMRGVELTAGGARRWQLGFHDSKAGGGGKGATFERVRCNSSYS